MKKPLTIYLNDFDKWIYVEDSSIQAKSIDRSFVYMEEVIFQ